MAGKDLYGVLGVQRTATQDEIRQRYRKLARELHPDVRPGDKAAEDRFKEVSAAYSVLQDERKRKLYDEFGEVALQAGFDEQKAEQLRSMGGAGRFFDWGSWQQDAFSDFSQGGGFEDLLGSILGGRFRGGGMPRGPRRGRDVEAEVEIDLPLAVRGGTTTLVMSGRSDRVEVRVPPGIRDGQALRLQGLGEPGQQGGPAGDLFVRVRIAEHPTYRREGDDLLVDVPVTVQEALEGAKVRFQGPSGEVTLTVPPGTQSGRQLRLRGLGVAGRGSLIAKIVVVIPEGAAPDRLLELAREMASFYGSDPRGRVQF